MNSIIPKINHSNLRVINQLQKNFKITNEKMYRHNINFLFCDIQSKYIKKIANNQELILKAKVMAEVSKIFKFNQLVSEQNTQVFGETISEIKDNLNDNTLIFPKSRFSMFSEEEIEQMPEDNIYILLGIETHICVYQTVLNFVKKNRNIIVLADAVSSNNLGERKNALQNMREIGCYITTCQELIFLLLQDANDKNFSSVLRILKDLCSMPSNLLLDKEEVKIQY